MRTIERLAERNRNAGGCRPVTLSFLGDSVTHGCFEVSIDHENQIDIVYEPAQAYPYRLKRRLDSLYPAAAVSVVNAGVSGECATQGAGRIARDALFCQPDLVVLAFGLNDAMNPDVAGGLADYRAAMRTMIQATRAADAECVVLTPSHLCAYVSGALREPALREIAARSAQVRQDGVLKRYADAAREVACESGAALADANAAWDLMAENGIDTTRLLCNHINHPSREMHELFVQTLLETLMRR